MKNFPLLNRISLIQTNNQVQQVLKCVKLAPRVEETSFTCPVDKLNTKKAEKKLRQCRLFTFVGHYASRKISYGMLTEVCRAQLNYLKLSCFLRYPYPLSMKPYLYFF